MFKYIKENYIINTNIIDLGGNIGTTSLLMSEVLSKNCKIYTFEPIYSNILLQNIIDNNLIDQIELYPFGVGNKEEIFKIKNPDLETIDNFGALSLINNKTQQNGLEIQIVPLDIFNFENVSLIKIDVEHMEIQVLEGCLDLITKYKPTILIETYQMDVLKETYVFKNLLELGYTIEPIKEGFYDFIMKIK